PSATTNTCAFSDISEGTVSVVVIQRVPVVIRDVNVFESVVVVIADRHAHSVTILRHAGESRFFGHIGEGAIGILVIQTIPELAIGLIGGLTFGHGVIDLCAIDKENVQPSIVVVIQERDASAHGLDQVLVRSGRVFVFEVD